jgi:ATP-dependent Clp protease ATP-binding subunit ClpC
VFDRFTDRARRVLVLAQEEAHRLDHGFIGTEHLLLGLISEGEGVAARALESLGLSLSAVRDRVEHLIGDSGGPATGSPPFTPRAKKVLELSLREALGLGHNYIGTEHMLLGLVREGEGVASQVLVDSGVDLTRVRQKVVELLSAAGEGKDSVSEAPSGDPPQCARCRAGLAEAATYRRLDVAGEGGDEPVTVAIVYCRRCGTAVGTAS